MADEALEHDSYDSQALWRLSPHRSVTRGVHTIFEANDVQLTDKSSIKLESIQVHPMNDRCKLLGCMLAAFRGPLRQQRVNCAEFAFCPDQERMWVYGALTKWRPCSRCGRWRSTTIRRMMRVSAFPFQFVHFWEMMP